jgi:7-carboxy-7-deazaguanine synthase
VIFMKIAEIFESIQGEGRLAGVPSVFVRMSGCNLRCVFCDTPYTSWDPEGDSLDVDSIMDRLVQYAPRHVVVTGGEPLIAAEIIDLCSALRSHGYHITVETAATVFKPVVCDLASLSPKRGNSTPHDRDGGRFALLHEERRWRPDVIRAFMERSDYQLKFVVDTPADVEDVCRALEELPTADRERVLLMPQGVSRADLADRAPWLVAACMKHGFRYCPRIHIELFGNVRGT